jgi:hypothetical protein
MAVHEPCARVVGFECKDHITLGGEGGSVATGRVVSLKAREITVPERVFSLIEDIEVMAVEMDGVR